MKIEISKLKAFIIWCLSFIAGIFAGPLVPFRRDIIVVMAISFLVIFIFWFTDKTVRIISFAALLLLVGFVRFNFSNHREGPQCINYYNDYPALSVIEGVVTDEPDKRSDSTQLVIAVQKVTIEELGREVDGKILIKTNRFPEYKYGDRVKITGEIKSPPEFEDFSYKNYLSRFGIYSVMWWPKVSFIDHNQGNMIYSFLYGIKEKFAESLGMSMPEPVSSLTLGLLLGVRHSIPDDLINVFNVVGITHIIAISGYNITIIARVLARATKNLARRLVFVLSSLGIISFVILAGASASVVRAGIMGILILVAAQIGRKGDALVALFFTAAVMVGINPQILRFDIGFQLSFLATLGLILFANGIEERFSKAPSFIRESLAATIAAQIMAVPLIFYYFGKISLVAPLANVLILPIVPLAMFFGFFAGVAGMVFAFAGQLVGWIGWLLGMYIIKTAEVLSGIPGASFDFGKISSWWIVAFYTLALSGWFLLSKRRARIKIREEAK